MGMRTILVAGVVLVLYGCNADPSQTSPDAGSPSTTATPTSSSSSTTNAPRASTPTVEVYDDFSTARPQKPLQEWPVRSGGWAMDGVGFSNDGNGGITQGEVYVTYTGRASRIGPTEFAVQVLRRGRVVITLRGSARDLRPGRRTRVEVGSSERYVTDLDFTYKLSARAPRTG